MPRDSTTSPSVPLGILTVVLTLAGWSAVPLFIRHFADHIDLWTSNGWRYGFSALLWLPVVLGIAMVKRLPKGLWKSAIIPGLINAAGQVCFTWAHYVIDPALLTFGLRSQLVFVAVGAWIMFPRERAIIGTKSYIAGAALLILGMIGVLFLDEAALKPGETVPPTHFWGIALAVLSGLLFAAYGLAVRKCMEGIPSVIAFGAICQITGAIMVGLMLAFGNDLGRTALNLAADQFMWLLVSAVIGIALGHVFYYMSIARLGVAVTAGILQLQPFLVAIGSYQLYHERLSSLQWMGGCMAVGGALLMLGVQYRQSRAKHVPAERDLAIAEGESGA